MKRKILLIVLGMGVVTLVASLLWIKQTTPTPAPAVKSVSTVPGDDKNAQTNLATAIPAQHPIAPQAASQAKDFSNAPISLRRIVDLNEDALLRQQTARRLTKNLGEAELDTIYHFLQEYHAEDETQRGHVLKNELMDALSRQVVLPLELNRVLSQIVNDPSQNIVIRDYALQHLATAYERLAENDQLEAQRKMVEDHLWDALRETDSSLAGTGLLNLSRLASAGFAFDRDRIGQEAFRLAKDPSVHEIVRITAIQVCGQQSVSESIPALLETAKSETSVALRISAIGALGLIGGKSEIEELKTIAREQNQRMRPAITLALQRVEARVGQP